MCYILLSKRTKSDEISPEAEDTIKSLLYEKATDNPDGFYIKNGETEKRTMNFGEFSQALEVADAGNLLVHFRYATAGIVGKSNVHGWNYKGWQFVHNGWIPAFQAVKQKEADSLLFFRQLINDITANMTEAKIAKAISAKCEEHRFYGRAMLYHKRSDKMFLFGDWSCYLVNKNYLLISSSTLELRKAEKYYKINGVSFTETRPTGLHVIDREMRGIAVIEKFSKPDFKYKYLDSLKEIKYTYTSYNSQAGFGYRANESGIQEYHDKDVPEDDVVNRAWSMY